MIKLLPYLIGLICLSSCSSIVSSRIDPRQVDSIHFWYLPQWIESPISYRDCDYIIMSEDTNKDTVICDKNQICRFIDALNQLKPSKESQNFDLRVSSYVYIKDTVISVCVSFFNEITLINGIQMQPNQKFCNLIDEMLYKHLTIEDWKPDFLKVVGNGGGALKSAYAKKDFHRFWNEFPDTFNEFLELYGWKEDCIGPLYCWAYYHMEFLFCDSLPIDSIHLDKLFNIAKEASWDADTPNYFQRHWIDLLLKHPTECSTYLRTRPIGDVTGFWNFILYSPHPEQSSHKELCEKMQNIYGIETERYCQNSEG